MDNKTNITWPGWETVGVIGRGSFGTVYEIRRDILGDIERAALKHISIPSSADEIDNLMSEGMSAESITAAFRDQLNDIVEEYKLMRKLDDSPYVVRCEDVQYVQKDSELGWDILIKMELLRPFSGMLRSQAVISEAHVIALAEDMSRALVRCEELNILHRDIKPQNIFISDDGKFKLGDFGIARAKERTSTGTARVGTYDYMAPEVYFGRHYDKTADIYSLGMVLYWLLNERRMPFLPQTDEAPRMQEREAARMRRLNGEKLPPPANGSKDLKRIVLKCCAYKPEDRYADANALLRDVLALQDMPVPVKGRKRKAKHDHDTHVLIKLLLALWILATLTFGTWQMLNRVLANRDRTALPSVEETAVQTASLKETLTPTPTPVPTPQPTLTPQPTPTPKPTEDPNIPHMYIENVKLPENMVVGGVADLQGKITVDKGVIIQVKGRIVDESGNNVQKCTYYPYESSFDLYTAINKELVFGLLEPGHYTYIVSAIAENNSYTNGEEILIEYPFEIYYP